MQDIADHSRTYRINTFKRLIEEEHTRTMDNSGSQRNLLTHTDRIIHNQLIGISSQVQNLYQLLGSPPHIYFRYAIHMTRKGNEFSPTKAFVEIQVLGQHAHHG